MLNTTSSEFVALCREQVALLTQGLGASLSVVYLAEKWVDAGCSEAKLIPVVVYPDTAVVWEGTNLALPPQKQLPLTLGEINRREITQNKGAYGKVNQESQVTQEEFRLPNAQIVVPLIHEGVPMGLLVTAREDRSWSEQERREVDNIAHTLAIACILDRRRQWLEEQLHTQQILQEQQRDLLDNLLHQFRNPLTALRTFGKLLLKRLRPGDVNTQAAASIVRESDRLQELLQQFDQAIDLNVEDVSPLELRAQEVLIPATVEQPAKPVLLLPKVEEQQAICWVTEVLEPLLVSASAIAGERNLEMFTEITPDLQPVKANAKALREVLSNIIDNALKYTPEGGKILIQAARKRANFQGIAISDTGSGIPPQDLEHLFERHYRGVQANTGIPGTGLGLAIALQLVKQMQGEIEVKSPALWSDNNLTTAPGTTFIVWLPEVS
ncbi:MAG: GAF domain-containing sensor histidine kinase [Nostocaceae cyanobacterium]|nr:GAF domain-containing sensor histidine kinase [Nostocaceae cyanobacterium]